MSQRDASTMLEQFAQMGHVAGSEHCSRTHRTIVNAPIVNELVLTIAEVGAAPMVGQVVWSVLRWHFHCHFHYFWYFCICFCSHFFLSSLFDSDRCATRWSYFDAHTFGHLGNHVVRVVRLILDSRTTIRLDFFPCLIREPGTSRLNRNDSNEADIRSHV